ncbi:hypothetical protein KUC3_14260 [Alteromonas sp. KC3]|uniref:tetratricopeptide repeat-containing diguanylate cyclase n=1 Tax=unclassified Alteromonas TaxID=2614992 RepID=UPI001920BC3E|nr:MULTISPECIES: GGDEF domain-containing protein [unclassified Alteromonas]BCO18569.1 hypothetical protein KUC3_14260 [Alteromonas sp. KC3]BCO22530.1 hypothetical protein KUC14_13990 [Alteromonas sp. KC14]
MRVVLIVFFFIAISTNSLAQETTFEDVSDYFESDIPYEQKLQFLKQHETISKQWTSLHQGVFQQFIGTTYGEMAMLEEAEVHLTASIDILTSLPESKHLVHSLLERSYFQYVATNDTAVYCPDRYRALEIARVVNDPEQLVQALTSAAFCASDTRDFARGMGLLQEAISLHDTYQFPPSQEALIYNATGNIYKLNGLYQDAYHYIGKALAAWESINSTESTFNMRFTLTDLALQLEKFGEAQQHVNNMFSMANAANANQDFLFFSHISQGNVYEKQGYIEQAYQQFQKALALKDTTVEAGYINLLFFKLSISAFKLKKFELAKQYINNVANNLDNLPRYKYVVDVLQTGLAQSPDVIEVVDKALALDHFHAQSINELIEGQVILTAYTHNATINRMETQILQQQLAVTQLELENQLARERYNTLVVYVFICITLALSIAAYFLLRGRNYYRKAANTDFLTKCFNRRWAFEQGEKRFKEAKLNNSSMSVVVLDVDYFKHINDRYGHDVGDKVLKFIVRTLSAQLKTHDILARLGGEEFVVILPKSNLENASQFAEKLRLSLCETPFVTNGERLRITASFGVATLDNALSFEHIVNNADKALYAAKESGRNKVEVKRQ